MTDDKKKFHKDAFDNIPEEKRARILAVITSEFANHGFDNTSIQQIAEKSGISVGSVYKYFENKEEMFSMVVQEGLSSLESLLKNLSESDEDIVLKAETIVRSLLAFSREKPELIKLYCALTAGGNSEFLVSISQSIEALSARLYTEEIRSAQQTGDVRTDIDPAFFAFLLDNLFMMLQFSTSCDYYKQRFVLYNGPQRADDDEFIVSQMLKFLKAAFNFK